LDLDRRLDAQVLAALEAHHAMSGPRHPLDHRLDQRQQVVVGADLDRFLVALAHLDIDRPRHRDGLEGADRARLLRLPEPTVAACAGETASPSEARAAASQQGVQQGRTK
jgi:hypothetical protein